ncbi:MAG: formate/nitrite transporter family protein [Xanthobacteraceae bacterium]|jgi:formate transporter
MDPQQAMAQQRLRPKTEIFGLDAYAPSEIAEKVEQTGVAKAKLPLLPMFMLGVVAGGSIGLGALYYTIVASDASLGFAVSRVLGGLVFCLGLALVIVGGAELFTGNNLIVMAWANGRITTVELLRNWVVVFIGNLVGGIIMAMLVFLSHYLDLNDGKVELAALSVAKAKIELPFIVAFFKGVMCNILVCLAVWLAMGGRSVTDKILAVLLPISAFVAAGFEHCVANMYFIPLGIIAASMGKVPAAFDASSLTLGGAIHNLIPVTLGNIVGGSVLVGLVYFSIYNKTRGTALNGNMNQTT